MYLDNIFLDVTKNVNFPVVFRKILTVNFGVRAKSDILAQFYFLAVFIISLNNRAAILFY